MDIKDLEGMIWQVFIDEDVDGNVTIDTTESDGTWLIVSVDDELDSDEFETTVDCINSLERKFNVEIDWISGDRVNVEIIN
jgi:hypothetical protein